MLLLQIRLHCTQLKSYFPFVIAKSLCLIFHMPSFHICILLEQTNDEVILNVALYWANALMRTTAQTPERKLDPSLSHWHQSYLLFLYSFTLSPTTHTLIHIEFGKHTYRKVLDDMHIRHPPEEYGCVVYSKSISIHISVWDGAILFKSD